MVLSHARPQYFSVTKARNKQHPLVTEKSNPVFLKPGQLAWLTLLACQCMFVGFVASRAMVSIGMLGLALAALLSMPVRGIFKSYFSKPYLWGTALFFVLVLISGLNSADKAGWLVWLRIKIPFLVLPLCFAGLPPLPAKKLIAVLYSFILVMFVSAVLVLGNYVLNYAAINQSFLSGSSIPMPFSHIRYTLMLAFSFFCCVYLLFSGKHLYTAGEKWLQAFLALFAFVALHILSVRSSLLALYAGILYSAGYLVVKQRRYVLGLSLVAIIAALPFFAYRLVPSFHNRVKFMLYDLQEYRNGHVNNMSDGARLLSVKIGWQLWQQHKWAGVGAGDLRAETAKIYESAYPEIEVPNRKLPHNQFIWVMAGSGLIGLLLFIAAFFIPLLAKRRYACWPVMVLYLMVGSSFFTEATFEEQIGTGFYLIFLLLFLNYYEPHE